MARRRRQRVDDLPRERSRTQVRPAPPRRSLQVRRQPRLSVRGARDAHRRLARRDARQDRGVRTRPRLSRRRQEAGARSRRRAPPTSSGLDDAHLRRYRAGVRARMGIGFAHRMVRQEYDDSQSRARLVFFPRRDFYRRGIRRDGRAVSRPLRDVPAMPRPVSDGRARRRLRDAIGAVHLVSDDRKSRRHSARSAARSSATGSSVATSATTSAHGTTIMRPTTAPAI